MKTSSWINKLRAISKRLVPTDRVIVCGGRDIVTAELNTDIITLALSKLPKYVMIVAGGATGVDWVAFRIARTMGLHTAVVHANWLFYKAAAGPIRNKCMIEFMSPALVIAFPGGNGTMNMVQTAESFKVPVIRVPFNKHPRDEALPS